MSEGESIVHGMYNPWKELRRRRHLRLEVRPLPDGRRGCVVDNQITINADDDQAARRSTLTHELVHDERRIFPRNRVLRAREESTVERIAARRLIDLHRLVDVLGWTRHTSEVAEELWVDVPILAALVASLTAEERAWIDDQLDERGVA